MTYSATKFEVATSNHLGGDTFTRKSNNLTFDVDLGVKVTQNVAEYPLHHVTYSPTKFEVATSNGLGGDTVTRNATDGRQTDFDTKLIYPFFLKTKVGIIKEAIITCLIQYFEADFLWKVSLKILNSGIILKTFTHAMLVFKLRKLTHFRPIKFSIKSG